MIRSAAVGVAARGAASPNGGSSFQSGERIFRQGDHSDEIYLIRRGTVPIVLRLADSEIRALEEA